MSREQNKRCQTYNLGISPVFFDASLAGETNTSSPLNSGPRDALGNNASPVLGHGSLLGERSALFLETSSVVCEQTGSLNVYGRLGELEAQSLESTDGLAKLLPLVGVGNSFVKGTLGKTKHLSSNSDAALVEDFNGNLMHVVSNAFHE